MTVSWNLYQPWTRTPFPAFASLRHAGTLLISHSSVTLRPPVPPVSLTWRFLHWSDEVCSKLRKSCRGVCASLSLQHRGSWSSAGQLMKNPSGIHSIRLRDSLSLALCTQTSREGSGCSCSISPSVLCTSTKGFGSTVGLRKFKLHLSFSSLSLLLTGSYCRSHFQLRIRVNV